MKKKKIEDQKIEDQWLVEEFKKHSSSYFPNNHQEINSILDEFVKSNSKPTEEIKKTLKFYTKSDLIFLRRILEDTKMGKKQIKEDVKNICKILKKMQNILFQISFPKGGYRDHIPHQLRVYLLGWYLFKALFPYWEEIFVSEFFREIDFLLKEKETDKKALFEIAEIFKKIELGELTERQEFEKKIFDVWSVTALFHDIGYTIQGLPILTKGTEKLYENVNSLISIKMNYKINKKSGFRKKIKFLRKTVKYIYGRKASKIVSMLQEEEDHGVWSAFFLTSEEMLKRTQLLAKKFLNQLKNLTLWDYISFFYPPKYGQFLLKQGVDMECLLLLPDLYTKYLYVSSLLAILLHNKPFFIFLSTFLTLLVISDTLQEWNRFTLSEYKVKYFPRRVYIRFYGENEKVIVESKIFINNEKDSKEFYKKLCKAFECPDKWKKTFLSFQKRLLPYVDFIIQINGRDDMTIKVTYDGVKCSTNSL